MYRRAGRITGSVAEEVYTTNIDTITSHSLLNKIMQYQEIPKNKYTHFGIKTEPIAREYYKNTQNPHHKNLTVQICGSLVKEEFSHLGASSDGIVSCSCHKKRVLEIKCPFNYRKDLKNWEKDKSFSLNAEKSFKEKHRFYFQIQLHMFVHDLEECHFLYIVSKNPMKVS